MKVIIIRLTRKRVYGVIKETLFQINASSPWNMAVVVILYCIILF